MQIKQITQYVLDEKSYSLRELETHLRFHFLSQIDFESPEERREIQQRGLKKLENQGVSQESLDLGSQFIKNIESAYIPSVSIRWIDEQVGHGLFLEEGLDKGAYVGEYTGVVRKNDRRYFEPMNHYCYEYPVLDESGRSFVIDATQGNLTRFINHSSRPNLQPVTVFHNGFYHLIFLAKHPIEKGSQLSYDYGQNYWSIRTRAVELS